MSELLRKSCHPFTREARRLPCSIASVTHFAAAYSSPYRTTRVGGRSRTFTGQCYQPFCSGDATSHADAHWTVTKCRAREGWIRTPGLRPAWELGPHPPPNRDTPRTISTWPLRRRLLPSDPGCAHGFHRVTWRFPDRLGPARVRFDFIRFPFQIKSHCLRLSR